MQARGGEHGARFDYGPSGRKRRDTFRARIAALSDSKQLEHLIRDTLRP